MANKKTRSFALVVALAGCATYTPSRPTPTAYKLVDAARQGSIDDMERARAEGVQIDAINVRGETALIAAIEEKHTGVIKYLLANGALPDGPFGQLAHPICVAVQGANFEAVDLLIRAGAKVDVIDARSGHTPLTLAIMGDQTPIAVRLLQGKANPIFPTRWGKTPLQVAISARKGKAAAMLINVGADPRLLTWNEVLRATGDASELYAELEKRLPADHWPDDAEMRRIVGQIYQVVAQRGRDHLLDQTELINAAIKAGLDPDKPNPDGTTALEMAWRLHLPDAMIALLFNRASGASAQLRAINAEMAVTTVNPVRLRAAIANDPFTGPRLVGADKRKAIKLTLFYVASRSLNAALLQRYIETER